MTERMKSAAKIKRERQVKRQKIMLAAGAVCILAAVLIYIFVSGRNTDKDSAGDTAMAASAEVKKETGVSKMPEKTETLEEKVERVRKEATEAGYPDGVIELLSKNPETVEFVENYGEKKDSVPAAEIAELKEGEIPKLLQWDERWGYSPYGTSIVAVSGCGPTCLSMVFSGLTGDKTLTPARLAEYGTEHHYINEDNDTYWIFMSEAGSEWGIKSKEKMLDEETLKKELQAGHPVICSVGPGDFTQIGHFIVLAGYEDGKVIVHDPFSMENSNKKWEYAKFKDQIKSMWTYSMNQE